MPSGPQRGRPVPGAEPRPGLANMASLNLKRAWLRHPSHGSCDLKLAPWFGFAAALVHGGWGARPRSPSLHDRDSMQVLPGKPTWLPLTDSPLEAAPRGTELVGAHILLRVADACSPVSPTSSPRWALILKTLQEVGVLYLPRVTIAARNVGQSWGAGGMRCGAPRCRPSVTLLGAPGAAWPRVAASSPAFLL